MPAYLPNVWIKNIRGTCYTYALDIETNDRFYVGDLALGKRVNTKVSSSELIRLLLVELAAIGMEPVEVRKEQELSSGKWRICVSRTFEESGYYHFYRLDTNGYWSHKRPDELPTQYGKTGKMIKDIEVEVDNNYNVISYIDVSKARINGFCPK